MIPLFEVTIPAPDPPPVRRGRRWTRRDDGRPRCRRCRHPVRTEISLSYRLGPKCAKRLGVRRLRFGRRTRAFAVRKVGHVKGQLGLEIEQISVQSGHDVGERTSQCIEGRSPP
ncbi:hypothetical protein GCM10009556_055150 [Acrocarpospora pleiomorpha]